MLNSAANTPLNCLRVRYNEMSASIHIQKSLKQKYVKLIKTLLHHCKKLFLVKGVLTIN